jgi:hypothetical protein
MTIQTTNALTNPITGVFGTGQIQIFGASGTWIVPQGIGKVRARVWGAGGSWCSDGSYYGGGGGGGFAMKAIYDLTGVTSVPVTVGGGVVYKSSATSTGFTAGTSSFGSYISATGGTYACQTDINNGGTGIGGDINNTGGKGTFNSSSSGGGGGGVASVIGNGGNGPTSTNVPAPSTGGAGGGWSYSGGNISYVGGNGFLTLGGINNSASPTIWVPPQAFPVGSSVFNIDFIGTGGGGSYNQGGVNGGGCGNSGPLGGFPGGGNAYGSNTTTSAGGLVIVEW